MACNTWRVVLPPRTRCSLIQHASLLLNFPRRMDGRSPAVGRRADGLTPDGRGRTGGSLGRRQSELRYPPAWQETSFPCRRCRRRLPNPHLKSWMQVQSGSTRNWHRGAKSRPWAWVHSRISPDGRTEPVTLFCTSLLIVHKNTLISPALTTRKGGRGGECEMRRCERGADAGRDASHLSPMRWRRPERERELTTHDQTCKCGYKIYWSPVRNID